MENKDPCQGDAIAKSSAVDVLPLAAAESDQQPPDCTVPCLFELDDAGEATGTVMPFCSDVCRSAVGGEAYSGFKKAKAGVTSVAAFGYTPHCEHCSKELVFVEPGSGYAYVQEGGSSVEIYLCGCDSKDDAEKERLSCSEAAYRTSSVIAIPAKFHNAEFYELVERILKASLHFDYAGE